MQVRYRLWSWLIILLSGCAHQLEEPQQQGKSYARIQVALGYLQQREYDIAKQNIDKAIEYAPDYYLPYLVAAHYYQQIGNIASAEEQYQLSLIKGKTQGDVYNNYGAFLCQQGNVQQAFVMFETALQQPEYYRAAQTYENIALCAHQVGNRTKLHEAMMKLQPLSQERYERLSEYIK